MTKSDYIIPYKGEEAYVKLKVSLRKQLPGTCWDGQKVLGTDGWNLQLGPDTLSIHDDYIRATNINPNHDSFDLTLHEDRVLRDFDVAKVAQVKTTIDSFVN